MCHSRSLIPTVLMLTLPGHAQAPSSKAASNEGTLLLTILMRHDQG